MKKFLQAMIRKNGQYSKTAVMLWPAFASVLVMFWLDALGKADFNPTAAGILLGAGGITYAVANSKKFMG